MLTTQLLQLLANVEQNELENVSILALQKACLATADLSRVMSGSQRLLLYRGLLLNEPFKDNVKSFAPHAVAASSNHKAVAAEIYELLGQTDDLPLAEVEGFVFYFSGKAGVYFDDEFTAVARTVAKLIADAKLPTGMAQLQMFYQVLYMIFSDFVVPNAARKYEGSLEVLLRLLLQYHDPHLCLHFDQHQISVGHFVFDWVRRLFALNGAFTETLAVWDWLFIGGDPTISPFLAIAYLISQRHIYLALNNKEALMDVLEGTTLTISPAAAEAEVPLSDGRERPFVRSVDTRDLLRNADAASQSTPTSTRRVLEFLLFPSGGSINKSPGQLMGYYSSFVVLPIERDEMARSFAVEPIRKLILKTVALHEGPPLKYMLVDCRAASSFQFARLPTAVHVGDDLAFDNKMLDKVLDKLESVKGAHLCVFGTGRALAEESNLLKVLSLHFIQRGFPHVSFASGGFKALIPLIKANKIEMVRNRDKPQQVPQVQSSTSSATETFRAYLPRVEPEDVAQRAEEIKSIASEKVAAAKVWGWNVFQRVAEVWVPAAGKTAAATHWQAESTAPHLPSKVGPKMQVAGSEGSGNGNGNASRGHCQSGHKAASVPVTSLHPGAADSVEAAATATMFGIHPASSPTKEGRRIPNTTPFSLGTGEDDEGSDSDLGLITSVPPRKEGSSQAAPVTGQAQPLAPQADKGTTKEEAVVTSVSMEAPAALTSQKTQERTDPNATPSRAADLAEANSSEMNTLFATNPPAATSPDPSAKGGASSSPSPQRSEMLAAITAVESTRVRSVPRVETETQQADVDALFDDIFK